MIQNHMTPRPIKCGAKMPDGRACNEYAVVTNIQYDYDRLPIKDEPGECNLNEVHYYAVCPACGDRKLIDKPDND